MLDHYAAFALATALTTGMPPSPSCRAALDFAIAKTEANYSGFRDKVTSGTQAQYTALTATMRGRADTTTTDRTCLGLLNDWLHFFHDGHIAVRLSPSAPAGIVPDANPPASPPPATLRRLSAHTLLLTLPRFNNEQGAVVADLLRQHARELAAADNLIVDVHGNGGGSDFVWLPVFQLLYTRVVALVNSSIYSTPDNIVKYDRLLADTTIPAADKEETRQLADQLRNHPGEFVRRADDTIRFDAVAARPRRVAVVTAVGCQSSCENFVLASRQSGKVCLVGENTGGVLDYANQWHLDIPESPFVLWYPTSRSQRLPQDPVDVSGIAPDIRVPLSGPDPAVTLLALIERGKEWPCHS